MSSGGALEGAVSACPSRKNVFGNPYWLGTIRMPKPAASGDARKVAMAPRRPSTIALLRSAPAPDRASGGAESRTSKSASAWFLAASPAFPSARDCPQAGDATIAPKRRTTRTSFRSNMDHLGWRNKDPSIGITPPPPDYSSILRTVQYPSPVNRWGYSLGPADW